MKVLVTIISQQCSMYNIVKQPVSILLQLKRLAQVVKWKTPEALGAGHFSPLAAISIAFWDGASKMQLGALTSPFVLVLEINRSDISTALKSTYSNNGTWAYNGEPISIEVKHNMDRRRLQAASDAGLVTCHAYSQGSFGLNELGRQRILALGVGEQPSGPYRGAVE